MRTQPIAPATGPTGPQTPPSSPIDRLRPLIRTRQVRAFIDQPLTDAEMDAIAEVARWTGSSQNSQPWRFIAIREVETLRAIADAGLPNTRGLLTATAAIAVTLPDDARRALLMAYDDGRVSERILDAASLLGLGAGINWVRPDVREAVRSILGYPQDWLVRTIVALGHPTEEARRFTAAPGTARLPREDVMFTERWPAD